MEEVNPMVNTVIVMGRLTSDPELKQTPSGVPVMGFTVAVQRRYKKGEEREADFIDCVAWRQTAEFISRYFRKGQMILVEGQIQTRSFAYNGQKRKAVEVLVSQVSFGESRPSGEGDTSQEWEEDASSRIPSQQAFPQPDGFADLDAFENVQF